MTTVFVRGFDFGTEVPQIKQHCSKVGQVKHVEMSGNGAALVTYASEGQAQAAVQGLNQTTIPGNSRYIDVKLDEPSKGTKRTSVGSAKVLVRGFDYGTTDDQLVGHMGQAGQIEEVQWCTKGSAMVTYSTLEEACHAVSTLNSTTIAGNSRFIDVMSKTEEENGLPAKRFKGSGKGGAENAFVAMPGPSRGSAKVYVRGFDFGTTDEQILEHMGQAGWIEDFKWCTKGSVMVTYSSLEEAWHALSTLNSTTIAGNSRFIDVISKADEENGLPAKTFMGSGKGGAKGAFVWMPGPSMYDFMYGPPDYWGGEWYGKGFGMHDWTSKGACKGKSDSPGSGRVFVRGFDFGTTDEQLLQFCGQAGTIINTLWCDKGSAVVLYETKAQAVAAVQMLNGQIIPGNSRYVDVILKESE